MTIDYAIEKMIGDIPILYRQIFGAVWGIMGLWWAFKSGVLND